MKAPNIVSSWAKSNDVFMTNSDRTIQQWVYHISSKQPATFQILISVSAIVKIEVYLIEGPDEDEAEFTFEVPLTRLEEALDLSLMSARLWFEKLDPSKD